MQDSIGGNAKTLMFVNISPMGTNLDETIVSLAYATRVKQVTNGATRTADSKEVARLRNVILEIIRRPETLSVGQSSLIWRFLFSSSRVSNEESTVRWTMSSSEAKVFQEKTNKGRDGV